MIRTSAQKILSLLTPSEKREAAVLLILMIIGSVMEIFSLGILPAFIAVVSNPSIIDSRPWLSDFMKSMHIYTQADLIKTGAVLIIVVFIVKNVFNGYLISKRIHYTSGIQLRLSSHLLHLYYNAPYTFHLNRNTTDLFSKVSDEIKVVISGILLPSLTFIMDMLFTLSTLALLFVYEPIISLVSASIFAIAGALYWIAVRKKSLQFGTELSGMRTEMYKSILEGFGGLKDARVLNREKYFLGQTKYNFGRTINATAYHQIASLLSRPFIETLAILGILSIVLITVAQGRPMTSILSILALFAIAAVRLLPTINQLISAYTNVRSILFAIDPIYKDIKDLEQEELLLSDQPVGKIPFDNQISFNSVSFQYPGTSSFAVNEVSLTIKKGQAIGLVGTSGSGKTTLVDIMLGLLKPTSGNIMADQENIYSDIRAWQQHIGYIPQQIFLSDNTIRRNIAFGLSDEEIDDAKLHSAIVASQLETLIAELPDGLETMIGERGVRLSGGQRQRIGIARALYHNPQVLIMDEATSALDNITEKYVMEAVDRLKGERTIIMIAHRLSTVKNCDKLYLMKKGKIIDEGSYDDLLKYSNEFQQMNV